MRRCVVVAVLRMQKSHNQLRAESNEKCPNELHDRENWQMRSLSIDCRLQEMALCLKWNRKTNHRKLNEIGQLGKIYRSTNNHFSFSFSPLSQSCQYRGGTGSQSLCRRSDPYLAFTRSLCLLSACKILSATNLIYALGCIVIELQWILFTVRWPLANVGIVIVATTDRTTKRPTDRPVDRTRICKQ